jgi:hypothetical protein
MGVFLAVAALLLLMNGLFFFILKNAALRLGKFSKLNMLHAANIYDELLENRELELKDIQRRIGEGKAAPGAEPPAAEAGMRAGAGDGGLPAPRSFAPPGGEYRDRHFAEGYRLLRGSVLSDREAAVDAALAQRGALGVAAPTAPPPPSPSTGCDSQATRCARQARGPAHFKAPGGA